MCINIFGIKIHIGMMFAVFFALAVNIKECKMFLFTLFFSALHEICHILFLKKYGCTDIQLYFLPAGIKLTSCGFNLLFYKKAMITVLSAPLINLILSGLFYLLYCFFEKSILFNMSIINLLLGGINLFPLSFLDGGRALDCFLKSFLPLEKAERLLDITSIISLSIMFLIFFIMAINGKYLIFLLIFFIYCLIGRFCDKTHSSHLEKSRKKWYYKCK